MKGSKEKIKLFIFEVLVVLGLVLILSSLSAVVTTATTGTGIWSTDIISIETMVRFSLGLAIVLSVSVIRLTPDKSSFSSSKTKDQPKKISLSHGNY